MSNWRLHFVYLVIVAVLLVVLGIALDRPEKVVEVTKYHTDTTVVFKTDTLVITKFVEVEKIVVDTLYLPSEGRDSVPIPINSYRFFEKDQYDIYAHGYNVGLDNVTVFPKTETTYITNTVEREIVLQRWECYLGLNLGVIDKQVIPSLVLSVKAPKNFLFGANMTYYNNALIYGGGIQYKITHNK